MLGLWVFSWASAAQAQSATPDCPFTFDVPGGYTRNWELRLADSAPGGDEIYDKVPLDSWTGPGHLRLDIRCRRDGTATVPAERISNICPINDPLLPQSEFCGPRDDALFEFGHQVFRYGIDDLSEVERFHGWEYTAWKPGKGFIEIFVGHDTGARESREPYDVFDDARIVATNRMARSLMKSVR